MTTEEIKQERSIPVASRIDMVNLANLAIMWESRGYMIRSMSQLVSWSIDLLVQELGKAEIFKERIETLAEANKALAYRGLYQRSMKGRSEKKIGIALGFEALRAEGIDPKEHASDAYETIHPPNQVQPQTDRDNIGSVRQIFEQQKLKKQAAEAEKRKAVKDGKEAGTVVSEGVTEEEIVAKEQANLAETKQQLDEADEKIRQQPKKGK